jgi:hypothetical protein
MRDPVLLLNLLIHQNEQQGSEKEVVLELTRDELQCLISTLDKINEVHTISPLLHTFTQLYSLSLFLSDCPRTQGVIIREQTKPNKERKLPIRSVFQRSFLSQFSHSEGP